MKIRLGELKNLIREAMVSPEGAVEKNLGMVEHRVNGVYQLVLFRPIHEIRTHVRMLTGPFKGERKNKVQLVPYVIDVVAYISATEHSGEGTWRVDEVMSAERGLGPLCYDIAMSRLGWLAPSDGPTSDAAAAVWKKYAHRGLQAKRIHSTHGTDWDGVAYGGASVDTSSLESIASKHISLLSDLLGADEGSVEAEIIRAGQKWFLTSYHRA